MYEKVILIGAGGHGKVVADVVNAAGDLVIGFLDDSLEKKECYGLPVVGRVSDAPHFSGYKFLISIGDNSVRRMIAEQMTLPWYTAIHPSAVVSMTAKIGSGSVVMPGAVINADAEIGNHCIINTGAIVEHENHISDFVHISPKAALGGQVHIGIETHIGIGAAVKNNIKVCERCVIGAGATVVHDIDFSGTYAGVPAKKMGDKM